MKNLIILVAAALLMMTPSVASANLLTDWDFEATGSAAWSVQGTAFNFNFDSTAAAYSDLEGLEILCSSGAWAEAYAFQHVTPVAPGDTWFASVYAKTIDLTNAGVKLQTSFRKADYTTLSTIESSELQGTNDWTQLTLSGVAPLDTAFATYKLYVSRWGEAQSGTAYFDDANATIDPVPEPGSLIVLGSLSTGLIGLFAISRKRR